MASDWKPPIKEINGVNLSNYFPHQRSYNSVVFIHKKYLDQPKRSEERREKFKPRKKKECKQDKSQQFNSEKNTEISKDRTYKVSNYNDSVLDQTIKFAKNIVPLVMPPSDEKQPVFYTIKTTQKHHKKKDKKPPEASFEHQEATQIGDSKKVIETYRKIKKESFSVRESISHSSSNTLDDLNINQSLCCTFSEVSEKKYHRKEKSHSKKRNEGQKLVVSESFEALATENAGDSKIKIHLMNEKDKNFLSDSIKVPILSAIRECMAELNNNNSNTELTTVQKVLKCNTHKLDSILDKLTCIEKKLESQGPAAKILPRVQMQMPKPKASSRLEELGEDIEMRDDYSSEEEMHQELLDRRSKSAVIELVAEDNLEKKTDAGGDVTGTLKATSTVGVKPERPNRVPARFCWTDAARK